VLAVSGYVSLGSIAAAVTLPFLSWCFHPGDVARLAFSIIAGAFSIYKHRANIERLMNGTELGFRSKPRVNELEAEKKGEPSEEAPPDKSNATGRLGERHNS
jgi:glycerol-3-phosphate acyltransferase PlsY